jgi:hypothetical protein
VRPHREPIKTGSSTPSSLPHPPEWTKGGDHDPIVPADGIVTTTFLHATSASIWYTLHTKHNNGPRALDRSKSITMFTATRSSWWGPSTSQQQEVSRVPVTESGWGHQRWTRWSGARLISRSAADREPPTPMEIHHQQRRTPKTLTLMGQWVGLWFTAAKAFPT